MRVSEQQCPYEPLEAESDKSDDECVGRRRWTRTELQETANDVEEVLHLVHKQEDLLFAAKSTQHQQRKRERVLTRTPRSSQQTYVDLRKHAFDALDVEEVREVAHNLVHKHTRTALSTRGRALRERREGDIDDANAQPRTSISVAAWL